MFLIKHGDTVHIWAKVKSEPDLNPPAPIHAHEQSEVLRNTPAREKDKISKKMHRVMDHNKLFYCTNNEIVIGQMRQTNMDPIHAEVSVMVVYLCSGAHESSRKGDAYNT